MADLTGKNISLVLGSGGARGLSHIGAIKVLKEKGANITEIVGCSIGSLVGGFQAIDKLEIFEEFVTDLSGYDVFSLLDFTWKGAGFVKGSKVLNKLKNIIPDFNIEDSPTLLSLIATNITKKESLSIEKGSFYKGVRASIAIPGILTAIKHKDGELVDGGVLNPLPLDAVKVKENLVVAVNLDGKPAESLIPDTNKEPSTLTVLQASYYAMRSQISSLSIELYKPDILIEIPRDLSGIWDYDKAEEIIENGKEISRKAIDEYLNGQH